jgi:hypothetical protein
MWTNAEEFVDYLDTAADSRPDGVPNPHADRVKAIEPALGDGVRVQVDALLDAARRLIAAECCGFLVGADTRSEKWRPFVRWERELVGPHDTIVSFNYDRVVETLIEARNALATHIVGVSASKIEVVLPQNVIDREDLQGCCPLLKLHGSVDWKKVTGATGPATVYEKSKPEFALACPATELAMATPGPSKKREADGFKGAWDLACDALKAADTIVFLGFRFPETDADARETLLEAVRENDHGNPLNNHHLAVHVVLGLPSPQSERLETLLRFVSGTRREEVVNRTSGAGRLRTFSVHTHPLFAQDFLAVVRREDIV